MDPCSQSDFTNLEEIAKANFPKDKPLQEEWLDMIGSTDIGPECVLAGGFKINRNGKKIEYEPGVYGWIASSCDGGSTITPNSRINFHALQLLYRCRDASGFRHSMRKVIEKYT